MKPYFKYILLTIVILATTSTMAAKPVDKHKTKQKQPTKVTVVVNNTPKSKGKGNNNGNSKNKSNSNKALTKAQTPPKHKPQIVLQPNESIKYTYISHAEAQHLIDHEVNMVLVDVRSNRNYRDGHIQTAINLPYDKLTDAMIKEKLPRKNQLILLYCRSGETSVKVAKRLCQMGYRNVKVIGGVTMLTSPIIRSSR